MKKGIIIVLIVVALVGVGAYFYVFHKPHRNPSAETATYTLKATELAQEFVDNETAANGRYIDKVVELQGTAMEVRGSTLILDNAVSCTAASEMAFEGIQAGDELVIKGRVIGFDELFEEVKLDNCVKL